MKKKICPFCGKKFSHNLWKHKYCSALCFVMAKDWKWQEIKKEKKQ